MNSEHSAFRIPNSAFKKLRVLIVEDSEDDAILLLRELRRGGYEPVFERVETSESMKSALEKQEWDLIVSDYMLPRFSGLAALAVLKESGLDLPFIVMSGNIGEDVAVGAMKAGAHDYILKGNVKRLVPAIERELREAEVRRERFDAEQELKNSRERLRNLTSHLQNVREEERIYIAREIHDELGQALTALKMDIAWLGSKYQDHEQISKKTKSMLEDIDSTIRTVKKIVSELRPGVLDHLGIIAAMEWLSKEFQERMRITCEVSFSHEDITLEKDLATTIFCIFQETLTNVARHAEATRVEARLEECGDAVILTVRDNGRGITEEQIAGSHSFGLLGIRERVRFWGGEVTITGVPDAGTAVIVKLPLGSGDTLS